MITDELIAQSGESQPQGSTPTQNMEALHSNADALLQSLSRLDPAIYQWFQYSFGGNSRSFTGDQMTEYVELLQRVIKALQSGDYTSIQGMKLGFGPEFEKYIDNRIAQQNTQQNQTFETNMRDTSLLSSGEQLQQLGLSSSGVLQTGGAVHSGVQTANNSMQNLSQQKSINRYNQNMSMARSLISMAGSMASSGIYGGALGAAKNAAASVATTAAHSGLKAMNAVQKASSGDWSKQWDSLIRRLDGTANMSKAVPDDSLPF